MYKIEYLETAKEKYFHLIPADKKLAIKKAIESRLTADPLAFGKPLRRSLKKCYRLRLANYRVIYRVDEKNMIVVIIAIGHRRDIYRDYK